MPNFESLPIRKGSEAPKVEYQPVPKDIPRGENALFLYIQETYKDFLDQLEPKERQDLVNKLRALADKYITNDQNFDFTNFSNAAFEFMKTQRLRKRLREN